MLGRGERRSIVQVDSKTKLSVTDTIQFYEATQDIAEMEWENQGSTIIWWGGIALDPANNVGLRLRPSSTRIFVNILKGAKIYYMTASGTSTIGINELP